MKGLVWTYEALPSPYQSLDTWISDNISRTDWNTPKSRHQHLDRVKSSMGSFCSLLHLS